LILISKNLIPVPIFQQKEKGFNVLMWGYGGWGFFAARVGLALCWASAAGGAGWVKAGGKEKKAHSFEI